MGADPPGVYITAAEAARICGFGGARDFLNAVAADLNAPPPKHGGPLGGPLFATSDVLRWNEVRLQKHEGQSHD